MVESKCVKRPDYNVVFRQPQDIISEPSQLECDRLSQDSRFYVNACQDLNGLHLD